MSVHAPGPWRHALAVVENAPSVHVITRGGWGAPNIAIAYSEEDARLIAAAPELLAALRLTTSVLAGAVLALGGGPDSAQEALAAAGAAMRKATEA